eukprot:3783637-Ditylum_brightwellii.AAC.1
MANLALIATSAMTNFAGVAATAAYGLACVAHLIILMMTNTMEYCRRCNCKRSRVFSIMFYLKLFNECVQSIHLTHCNSTIHQG